MLSRAWRQGEYKEHTQHSEQNSEKTLENDMVRDWSRGKLEAPRPTEVRNTCGSSKVDTTGSIIWAGFF